MNNNSSLSGIIRAILFALLCSAAGTASATATFGTRLDSYCATRPTQATAPQQSRPYRASNSSCLLCHTSVNATANNLNTLGSASLSCTSTTCSTAVNPFCVAHAPSGASITAPPANTSVAQGASLTFTAADATNPDGFPLIYTWLFTGGMASVVGQSVSVPMTVTGSITSTLNVTNSVGMLATGTPPTRTVTVTTATLPNLTVTPATLTFAAAAGGNAPAAQSLSVTSSGAQVSISAAASTSSGGNWLSVDPASSTTPSTLNVTVNPAGLAAGTYSGTVTITSGGASNSPVTVAVTLAVTGGGVLPVANIVAPAINVSVLPGGRVIFRGSATDPANSPLTYRWTFPGGEPSRSTRQNPGAVRFRNPGTFTVTLTVTNNRGVASVPVTRVITVAVPNGTPSLGEEECRDVDEHREHRDHADRDHEDHQGREDRQDQGDNDSQGDNGDHIAVDVD